MNHTISRRRFLTSSTLAITAAATGPLRVTAAQQTRRFPFGFSLYGMKMLKTADALHACKEIGYDCVELALMPGWPTEPKLLSSDDRRDLKKLLADLNLALPALMENLNLLAEETDHKTNLDKLKAAAELAHALSPDRPPLMETVLGGRPAQWDEVKARMAERLKSWAEVARAAGIVIAVKPHVGGALHTPDGALWLLKQVNDPAIKLAYDYSHYQLRGLSLKETIAALVPHSVFIHIKDAKGDAAKFEFQLPGETGTVNYADYFKLSQAAGYRGSVLVEVSGQISGKPGYDPIAAARTSFANIAPSLK